MEQAVGKAIAQVIAQAANSGMLQAGAIGALGAGAATRLSGGGKRASKKRPSSRRQGPPSGGGTVKPHGDSEGSYRVSKRKRKTTKRKPSLKREVAKLKKRVGKQPPVSRTMVRNLVPLQLEFAIGASADSNKKHLYMVKCFDHVDIEAALAAGLLAANTRIKLANIYTQYRLRNFYLGNAEIKYQFVRCMDDDAESYIQNVREESSARGISSNGEQAIVAASATTNEFPAHLAINMDSEQFMTKCFGVHANKFKPMGQVATTVLGPGDTLKLSQKLGSRIYKPETFDQEAFSFLSGDIFLIMTVVGDLAFQNPGDGSAPKLATFDGHCLVGSRFQSFDVVSYDGEGIRTLAVDSTFDDTNITSAGVRRITNEDPTLE